MKAIIEITANNFDVKFEDKGEIKTFEELDFTLRLRVLHTFPLIEQMLINKYRELLDKWPIIFAFMSYRLWSAEEEAYLREHYAATPNAELARSLNRTPPSIQKHALILGLNKAPQTDPKVAEWLMNNYANYSISFCATMTGLTPKQVTNFAHKHGLRKSERYRRECQDFSNARYKEQRREWRLKHLDRFKEYDRRYRAKKRLEKLKANEIPQAEKEAD